MNCSSFDIMSSFNESLKNINIINLAIFIIVTYIILFILSENFDIFNINWIYTIIILYLIFSLRKSYKSFKDDVNNIFSKIQLRYILLIVFLNIFLSYGMLYLSIGLVTTFPSLDFLVNFSVPSMSFMSYVPIIGSFISTIIISPIFEELLFRGIFLNKLKLFVPTVFAVLITSLLFGALHSFGSMISAVIFGICMAIMYLKTENICVPIFAHFLNNLFAEIIRFVDVNNIIFTNFWVIAIMSLLAIISAILIFGSFIDELNKIKYKKG